MRKLHRLALPVLALALVVLPAVAATAADDDGVRHRVVRVEKECAGENCPQAKTHALFVDENGKVTRLDGEDLHWVEGEKVGPHAQHFVFHDDGPGFVFRHGGSFLGVSLTELTPELRGHFGAREDAGVMVSQVVEDSPAWRAGVQVGDVITAVDGEPVASGRALAHAIRQQEAGTTVGVEVLRDGRYETFDATLEEREVEKHHEIIWGAAEGSHDFKHEAFQAACGDAEECEVEVVCNGADCDCTVNGAAAECAALHVGDE